MAKHFITIILCIWMLLVQWVLPMPASSYSGDDDLDEIIGGSVLPKGINGYMASIRTYATSSSGGFGICGGTIIDSRNILTAAHCVYDLTATGKVEVYVRTWSILPQDSFAMKFTLTLSDIRIHENYIGLANAYLDDIAVLRLPSAIDFSRYTDPATGKIVWATPVSMASSNYTTYEGADVQASGWGLTSDPSPTATISYDLKMTTLYVKTKGECVTTFGNYYDHTRQLCVYAPGTSICKGDSGGPVTYRAVQIGITSYIKGTCSANGAVFTRVSYYRYWLSKNMIAV